MKIALRDNIGSFNLPGDLFFAPLGDPTSFSLIRIPLGGNMV